MLENDILPIVQHFAYIEVCGLGGAMIRGETDLWRGYDPLAQRNAKAGDAPRGRSARISSPSSATCSARKVASVTS